MPSRREFVHLMPAVAAMQATGQQTVLPSQLFRFEDLTARPSGPDGKNKSRGMFDGKTHTGERIEMHQTELGPGMAPHPPHHHVHEEMILVWQGSVEATINGKSALLGPGSVAYIASGEEHGVRNTGTSPATYFVITIRGNS